MEMTTFHLINNLMEFYIVYRYFQIYLGRFRRSMKEVIILTFLLFVLYTIVNMIGLPLLNLVAFNLTLLIISMQFEGTWKRKIFYILALDGLIVGIELLLFQIFRLLGHDMVGNYIYHGLTATIIRLFVVHFLCLKHKSREYELETKSVVTISMVWGLLLIYILVFTPDIHTTAEASARWIFLEVMLLVLSIMVWSLIEVSAQNYSNRMKEREAAMRLEMQETYYRQSKEHESDIRRYRHDMKNSLLGVLGTDKNKWEEKLGELVEELDRISMHDYSENEMINFILNHKIPKMSILPENLRIKIVAPNILNIRATEFSVLLGNLLDNSVEALQNLPIEKRMLKVEIDDCPPITKIYVSNTYDPEQENRNAFDPDRGIGLSSVQQIVAKYGGTYHVFRDKDTYSTEIIMTLL